MLDTRENIRKVSEVNGTDIFFDSFRNRFFYWDNGKMKTSVSLSKIQNRLNK